MKNVALIERVPDQRSLAKPSGEKAGKQDEPQRVTPWTIPIAALLQSIPPLVELIVVVGPAVSFTEVPES